VSWAGTRIPVEFLLEKLGQGISVEEVLEPYPGLTVEDLRAARAYMEALIRPKA
jgi:uncharacterized protein (DUF433 family)